MAFVRIVDVDDVQHYVRYEAIVVVREASAGRSEVDVAGAQSPILMKGHAAEVIDEIINAEARDRPKYMS